MSQQYKGPPFYFCTYKGQYYKEKKCSPPVGQSPNPNYQAQPEQTILQPPKKALVYKGPQYLMSKKRLHSWASKFKFR